MTETTTQTKPGFTPEQYQRAGTTVYALNADGVNRFSAHVDPGFDNDYERTSRVELEATAALFEAAPALYEALEELSAAIDDGLCNSGIPGFDPDRLERAQVASAAALRLARGEG